MAQADEIKESFCAGLRRAARFDAPFAYFRACDLFPSEVLEALTALPLDAAKPAMGRRDDVDSRFYFDEKRRESDTTVAAVSEALQSRDVAEAIETLCGAALGGTFLRLEYTIDVDGFWLEPHTDLGVKKLTGLIALSRHAAEAELGTDLYLSPEERFGRVPFTRNDATFFVPGSRTWHGFAQRPISGLRKSLILNYVGPEWRSREQLAFPDCPIRLG